MAFVEKEVRSKNVVDTGILKRVSNIKINGKDTCSVEKELGAVSNPFEASLA